MADNSNIIIREAKSEDLRIIHEFANVIWPIAYSEILSRGQLEYMLQQIYSESSLQKQFKSNHKFLVAEENNKPVAFAVQRNGPAPAVQWLCNRISCGILPCCRPCWASHASVERMARSI